ncbi:nuclear pore complex protein Nup58 isoform X1 [Plutella xylostella]|uniref:nuclear pore complex protein Nup58 isoform X1 n=1 Tax=Plutella xylostella TaxID=51655 RepID=UPI00203262C7|nr:nuclear pore complex protein Nup58 isoform X1 [Plutella xylostella]
MSFSFGTPSSAPATTGLTGGFNFGANKPATPGFGLTATSQPSTGMFGTPASAAPAFGTATPSFGAAATPAFGATATPSFGATATPAFGATSTPGFGATSTPAFGATSTPAFGATTTPSFGASAAPTFGSTTAPAFGTTGLGTGGLNFGAASTATSQSTGLSFGAPAASTASTGLGGFGFGSTLTSTAQSTGLGGSLLGATSTAPGGLFVGSNPECSNIATFMSPTKSFEVNFPQHYVDMDIGIGPLILDDKSPSKSGKRNFYSIITPSSGPKLGTSTASSLQLTSAAPSLGLGGSGTTTTSLGIGATNTTTSGDGKSEAPKQTKLPTEISTSVDTFKEFVKKQKAISSEIMRISIKPFHKVERDAEQLVRSALSLGGEVARARAQSKRLRAAGARALAAADAVNNDPPNSEYEGSAPPAFIKELIAELEQQLITFRRQMDVADKQMQASPKLLSEQELNLGIRRMHESLVALAGRLQAVHAQVEAQKEQYLNLRKYVLKDQSNVFEGQAGNTSLDQILREAESGRKKSKLTGFDSLGGSVLSDPRTIGNINQLAGPTPFSYIGPTTTPIAETPVANWQPQAGNLSSSFNATGFGSFGAADQSSFQLQKPPGKRTKQ